MFTYNNTAAKNIAGAEFSRIMGAGNSYASRVAYMPGPLPRRTPRGFRAMVRRLITGASH